MAKRQVWKSAEFEEIDGAIETILENMRFLTSEGMQGHVRRDVDAMLLLLKAENDHYGTEWM